MALKKTDLQGIKSYLALKCEKCRIKYQSMTQKIWVTFLSWPRKKRIIVTSLIVAILVVVITATNVISSYLEQQAAVKAQAAPVPVITAKANLTTAPLTLSAVGTMQAILSVPVSFDADGVLASINAKAGQQVKKDQIIATLDSTADLAQLKYYQANLVLQQASYQRMLSIKDTGAISQQMLDSQKASVVQAQAQVDQQQAILNQKTFKAPFAGVLSNITGSNGSYLAKGTAIATLVQEAPLYVQFTLPVSDRPMIELGQAVTVTSGAYVGQSFKGILSYVAPQANSDSGTMTLQATIDNPDFLLLPGMFVSVSQLVNPNRQLLTVPDVAVMTDIVGQYVFKVEGTQVRKIYVNAGESIGGLTPISSGLNPGDTVVIAGQQKLNDQSPITLLSDPSLVNQINNDTQPTNPSVKQTTDTTDTSASTDTSTSTATGAANS